MIAELRGRNALLTGAAGGLGGAIAERLASEGVNLALTDFEAPEQLAETVRGAGVRAEALAADLTDPAQRDSLLAAAEARLGPIDLLVNSAGVEVIAPLVEMTPAEVDLVLAVNLRAPAALVQQAVPGMIERGGGHVVGIASLAGKFGPGWASTYAATKAALIALNQSLRHEHADDPVSFSCLVPGFIGERGMIRAFEDSGIEIPAGLGTSPLEAIPEAMMKALRTGRGEVIVSKGRPMKPLLTLNALAPRLTERIVRSSGLATVFRGVAEKRGRLGR